MIQMDQETRAEVLYGCRAIPLLLQALERAPIWRQKEPAYQLTNFENIRTLRMFAEASFGAPTAHAREPL
jgi:hypothetical protein